MLLQSVSPAYTYKYPIDINMSILSRGNEYEAILLASGIGPQIFPISLTHYQIEELKMTLRQAIDRLQLLCVLHHASHCCWMPFSRKCSLQMGH
jgi:hypothetical protein